MLCALIMAGGKGERFWPLSTDEKPKQFLNLLSNETMIQMTVKRISKLVPIERIFVVTAGNYVDLVKEQLPKIPERNIISEPMGKNTAPCIALSAAIINRYYKDAAIAVLPSDHLINNEEKFIDTIKSACDFTYRNKDAIVTLGMKPDRPETGYGYIKFADTVENNNGNDIMKVEKFVEKPDIEKAKEYISDGKYLWNGGIFIWKADTVLKLTKKYLRRTYDIISEITSSEDYHDSLNRRYCEVQSISIDYGIMENAEKIYTIPCDFGWDDVGSWHSVERYRKKDQDENIFEGHVINIDSKNNMVFVNSKPVVIAGLENIFVVENDDLIFIGSKDQISEIKEIKHKIS